MKPIQSINGKYRISSGLLLLFSASFVVWQMGVLYYAGTVMSLLGNTPSRLSEETTAIMIAAGYLASIAFMCLFPRKCVWAERILLPVALAATMLMLLPGFPLIPELFAVEIFVCTFSVGTMLSIAANLFTVETTWRDGILSICVGGLAVALLQSELIAIDFFTFTLISALLIAAQLVFYYLLPPDIRTPYVSRRSKPDMPLILLLGLWTIIAFPTLLLCFSSSFAESVPHGTGVLYLSAAILGALLFLLRKRLQGRSFRIFTGFFALSIFGFVLAYLSLRIPALRYIAIVLLSFNLVLSSLWIYFAAAAFHLYPTRFTGPIAAGMGLVLAFLHAGLLEALREHLELLYGIDAALSMALLVVFVFLEPYFTFALRQQSRPREEAASVPAEAKPASDYTDRLSEQERILARLILDGHTESSAAASMNITLNTEKGYRKSLYGKLNIHSKRELFELANRS